MSAILCCCKKDTFTTDSQAGLQVTADSLKFDTVFTSAGSITKAFKIINTNDQKLKLSTVKLMGGTSSAFKINVDGTSATQVNNVVIEANDSLYVFVQVNINPDANNVPFVISDSILITYNGNEKFIQLQAYGQNAVFLDSRAVAGNFTFTKDLPYVILGGLLVDSLATLTINRGAKIYLHADAPIIVNGTLLVNGTREEQVVFNGDRLDTDYKDLPASWPGIYFTTSSNNNILRFAVIKNAYQGVIAQGLATSSNPKVKISQCVIDNIYDAGILGINSTIYADNTLISNCGSNVLLAYGGNYSFTHCTVASYGNIFVEHKNPVLQVYNFIVQDKQTFTADLTALFKNCIFWGEGNVENEVEVDKEGNTIFNVTFDHVLYKAIKEPANALFTVPAIKQDPLFDSINISDFTFDFHFNNNAGAPAINTGTNTTFAKDLDDRPRANGLPDLGCYEK